MGQEEIFEIKVKDPFGKVLDRWVIMKCNFGDILRMLSNKYSLGLWITDRNKKEDSKDLDWAK